MSEQWQIRRGTTAENDDFTGAEGEITMDTDKKQLRVHDGTTQGGAGIIDPIVAFQVPTADNNYTWYRKYRSGWVEQGGYIAGNVTNSNDATFSVNLVVQMQNDRYTLTDSWGYADIANQNGKIALTSKTTTYFSYRTISLAGNARFQKFSWQVSGMAA